MERYRFTNLEQTIMEQSRVPYAVYQFVNKRVITLALSEGFLEMFGYTDLSEAYYDMDNDMYKDTHPDDVARIADAAFRFATEGGQYEVIYRTKNKSGDSYHIVHAKGEHVYTETGVRLAYVWYTDEGSYSEDNAQASELSSSLKNAIYEESLLKASYYDHLTGLPAMTYFFDLALERREQILAAGGGPAILYTDFGGMKYFNHKHGFAEGDKLLQAFARVLANIFGNENCSRLGQDHFGIITEEKTLEETLAKLFDECKEMNGGMNLPVHVGIYLHSMEDVSASTACDRAKLASDTLSNRYTSCFSYYDISMRDLEDKQQYIIANLDKAIEEKWITVYYQPIVRAVSGRVCDEEALARWIDPVRGFMSPADFIPTLEDARLIYKLDLCIVEQVLEKMRLMERAGYAIIPQSINLSRSDFDTCDIVEEIRRRVDAAGIPHSMITIEITESMMCSDFEFMKEQIDRFRNLGFPIWMDDFGSGYSSFDVLQEIKFDLLKFDMQFMRQFDMGDSGKIILTELLKMATSLGIDTVCEGVETEEQVQFLQETGCSKLQGYFYQKPIPVEKILEKYEQGRQIGFEDPKQSGYFETIGRVNLYDLGIIAQEIGGEFSNYFNTMPMSIIEVEGDRLRILRSNQSFREFLNKHFHLSYAQVTAEFLPIDDLNTVTFIKALRQCAADGSRIFLDEKLPDRSKVHACIRRIADNPTTGRISIAVAVLSVSVDEQDMTYANIARALAADYFNLYYVNLETEHFIEYSSAAGAEELAVERHGDDFFRASRRDALKFLYRDDRRDFIAAFTKENVIRDLDEQGAYTLTYRLLMNGEPVYVHMKALRMHGDAQHIIIGVSSIDSQVKQQALLDKARQDQIVFSRLMALSGDYLCIYLVDLKTDRYVQYSAAEVYEGLGLATEGEDFFNRAQELCRLTVLEEDQQKFCTHFIKERILQQIAEKKLYKVQYRLILDGVPKAVNARIALVQEADGEKLIVGINYISEEDQISHE